MHAVMAALDAFKPHTPDARHWVAAVSGWGEVLDCVSDSNEVQLDGLLASFECCKYFLLVVAVIIISYISGCRWACVELMDCFQKAAKSDVLICRLHM